VFPVKQAPGVPLPTGPGSAGADGRSQASWRAMTTAPPAPPGLQAAPARASRPRTALAPRARLLLAVAVALGVLARLHSPSALWLDEALSVEIARRPLPALLRALRNDGSPPLYYLLLHVWTGVLGTSDTAVRALSALFSLACLPFAWLSARRLGGRGTADAALLLLAVSPFAVRYATEARMYALVQLLVAAGLLALLRALERPTPARLAPVAVTSGLLSLTHYWSLFLLAATAGLLLVLSRRSAASGDGARSARRALVALAAGAVVFLPWLPTFLFQLAHTGAPWAAPAHLVDVYYSLTAWSGGGAGPAVLLTLVTLALALLAVAGHPAPGAVVLRRPLSRPALALLAGSLGPLVLGLVVAQVVAGSFAPRYSSVALVPALLLSALGLRALPERARLACLALVTVCGLLGALPLLGSTRRTQAAGTAAVLSSRLQAGDVVAYCPDQLGPAVSRLLPTGTDQVSYPDLSAPQLVDWVDYAQRSAAASPAAFARALDARTPGAIWLVSAAGYRTLEGQCEVVRERLEALRGKGRVLQQEDPAYDERQDVRRYPGRR